MKNFFVVSLLFLLISCSGGDENSNSVTEIDTKDVKGTINLRGMEGSKLNLHNNDGDFVAYKVEDSDGNTLTIAPTNRTLEDLKKPMNDDSFGSSSVFGSYEILEEKDNYIYFKQEKKKMGSDEMTVGYGFALINNGYLIESDGKEILDPIDNEKSAKALLEVAKSFKPE